jgi:uncharacterized protein (TIGR00725 family)
VAEEVGRAVAGAGAILVCGGLGGVMAASARGAKAGGGTTVALLPGDSRSEANPHMDIAFATGMGEMRNALVARACDGLIAVGGGYGTLSEIGFALKIGTPVVGLGTWDGIDGIVRADDPASAVASILGLIARSR